jgi:hypothetical protein
MCSFLVWKLKQQAVIKICLMLLSVFFLVYTIVWNNVFKYIFLHVCRKSLHMHIAVKITATAYVNFYADISYFLVENIIKETLNYNIINNMDLHAPAYWLYGPTYKLHESTYKLYEPAYEQKAYILNCITFWQRFVYRIRICGRIYGPCGRI